MLKILVILTLTNKIISQQIDLTPITNPIFPFSLGQARITTHKHSFIKYLNLSDIEKPALSLKINIKEIDPLMNSTGEFYPQLIHTYEHLKNLINQVDEKYNNVRPKRSIRTKRGLMNIVGKGYKWLFGLLDSDDAIRYDNAIKMLDQNQKSIFHDLQNYLTITKTFMNESTVTFNKIVKNQNLVNSQLKTLESDLNKFILFLRIRNFFDTMVIDCQNLINLLDNLENAILFAKLNQVHNKILPVFELREIIKTMNMLYEKGLPKFELIQSYYDLMMPEIHYFENNICFIFHVPVLQENLYNYYHLYPIPLNNQTLIPPKPYIILNSTSHHYEDNPCTTIENTCIYHVTQQVTHENCIPDILLGKANLVCQTNEIYIQQDIIEPVNDAYIITIPAKQLQIEKLCIQHGFTEITTSQLIHIPKQCSVKIKGYTYTNFRSQLEEVPLEILPIKTKQINASDAQWTPVQRINTDRLTELYKSAEETRIHKLQSVNFKETNSYSVLEIICLILLILLICYILYKLIFRNRIKLVQFLIQKKNNETELENNAPPLFSS